MPARTSQIHKDLIPYNAGVAILAPLNKNKKPDYTRAVATKYDFLTSTQTSVTRTTETLANGNGQDKDFVIDERYTVTVIGNTFDPVFHSAVTGRIETLPEKELIPEQVTQNLSETAEGGTLEITFGTGKDIEQLPAQDSDGNYNFVVEDSYGNTLVRADSPVFGAYSYDPEAKALQFSSEYAGAEIRVIYWWEDEESLRYDSNPILQQPEYQLQTFGITMSASTDEKYKVVTTVKRCTATGDIADQITQKAKSAPITYTFQSTPVPEGVSVYSQVFTKIRPSASDKDNVVNGGDDNFSTGSGAVTLP